MSEPFVASSAGVCVCPHGCPVIALYDESGELVAVAHIRLDTLEALIADLRRARADGEAAQRPVA